MFAVGCGDDDKRPIAPLRDGGYDEDAGVEAGVDAGPDAQPTDFGLTGPCLADETNVESYVPREVDPQPGPSLVANGNGFGLAFAEQAECGDALVVEQMPSNAPRPASRATRSECSGVRNAVAVPTGSVWLTAWLDDRDGAFQAYAAVLDPSAAPPAIPPARTPVSGSSDSKGSLALIRLTSGDNALLAWTETAAGGNGAIKVRPVRTSDGAAMLTENTVRQEAGELYTSLALAAVPSGGAVLGYVAGSGPTRSIFLQTLDDAGAPVGEPHLLSAAGDALATVSVAMKNEATDRGAVVYSVNPAGSRPGIHFLALDAAGDPVGRFRALSGGLERAGGIGVTPTLSGFVVAYRAVSDFNWDFGRIRVAFLGDSGNSVGDGVNDVIEASDFGGAPSIAVALDGRIALSWFDDDQGGNRTLKLLTYPCNR